MIDKEVLVIGAGLAGSEAAWQIANSGIAVTLVEMRPIRSTPAHHTNEFGELVCSNSFGALNPDRAAGLLQEELRTLEYKRNSNMDLNDNHKITIDMKNGEIYKNLTK